MTTKECLYELILLMNRNGMISNSAMKKLVAELYRAHGDSS